MRDALSIMDQAIACCGEGKLTAGLVRGLVGTVSSDVLESLMSAVAADSPQDALGIVRQRHGERNGRPEEGHQRGQPTAPADTGIGTEQVKPTQRSGQHP